MDNLIAISTLNDFIFCPYSIYLHNVYMDMDKDAYHATPQTRGRNAHAGVDNKTTTNNNILESLPVISNELGIYGKIDIYDRSKKILIERKYALKNIYRGQYYQLWAQFFCMVEMGYAVKSLAFYEFNNTKRLIDNIRENIRDKFSKLFTQDDSVVIFDVNNDKTEKYGNAIHRDQDLVFL